MWMGGRWSSVLCCVVLCCVVLCCAVLISKTEKGGGKAWSFFGGVDFRSAIGIGTAGEFFEEAEKRKRGVGRRIPL